MAICPSCQTQDKNFFAPRCHACNSDIGFIEQVFFSVFYGVVQIATVAFLFYVISIMISG